MPFPGEQKQHRAPTTDHGNNSAPVYLSEPELIGACMNVGDSKAASGQKTIPAWVRTTFRQHYQRKSVPVTCPLLI